MMMMRHGLLALILLVTSAVPLLANELSASQRETWLGAVAEAVENEDLAEARATLAEHPDDDHLLSHSWRGRVSALEDAWREAEVHFARALEHQADYRPAAEGRIQALAMLEDWPALRRMIGPWLEHADSPAPWWRAAAHAAWEDNDALIAEDIARRGLGRYPDDIVLGRILALAMEDIGDPQRSIAAWQRVANHAQAEAEDWYYLSHSLDRAEQHSQARRAMLIAHQLDPNHPSIADSYLAMLMDHDFADDAYQLAHTLLAGAVSEARPQRLLMAARSAEAKGAHTTAIAWLEAIDHEQRTTAWQLLYARSQAATGEPTVALEAIDQLIAQGQADANLRLWAAQLAWQEDILDQAEAHLRAVLARSTTDRSILQRTRMHLMRLLMQQGRYDEALQEAEALLQENPYNRNVEQLLHYLQAHVPDKQP
ncbi:MAG: hypothetical protein EA401_05420 [Planctomycetota bacterium]|nr:MAG: hypothetical protein EA401_05420 [Planctomycetota bacterium]